MLAVVLLHIAAFFLGAIPIGYIIGRLKGVDVRKTGSGNTGATNLARSLGKTAGLCTLIGDVAKGILSVYLARIFLGSIEAGSIEATLGFSAIMGHCFSPFLRFKGGKGVATSLGVFVVLLPLETLICALLFLLTFAVSRYVSLSSIIAVTSMPILILLLGSRSSDPTVIAASLLTTALIVFRHRTNLSRLRAGTESRFSFHRSS